MKKLIYLVCAFFTLQPASQSAEPKADLTNLSVTGGVEKGKARLTIEGWLNALGGEPEKSAFATTVHQSIRVDRSRVAETIVLRFDVVTGAPQELLLSVAGEGDIREVSGEGLQDWSVRREDKGNRTLVLRLRKSDKPLSKLSFTVAVEQDLKDIPSEVKLLTLAPAQPALFSGYVKIDSAPEMSVQLGEDSGLVPLNPKFLPEGLRPAATSTEADPLAFRFQGNTYALPLRLGLADPEARRVVMRNFQLEGELHASNAGFTLNARAVVKDVNGGRLDLLSGEIALTEFEQQPDCRLVFDQGKYQLVCSRAGEFPIRMKFEAKVHQGPEGTRGWSSVDFRVASAVLQPLLLTGLAAETQFQFVGAARPERSGTEFRTFLPADGTVKLSWKEARPESEGKLFYAAEMLSQISVAPGLMRQVALLDFKVMQGELNRVVLTLHGSGEVTRVSGADVLAWNLEPAPGSQDRRLVVQFNQAQKDHFALQVQMQTPLGAFPQVTDALQLKPEGATRFAGLFRVTNEGAVRLEVLQVSGVSQISPEKFPESDATRTALRAPGSQRFAYRFSGGDFALRIQADQIQPELGVSEILSYRAGENELSIEGEIEVEIREAPLRELLLRIPKGFGVARLSAAGMSDYFVRDLEDQTNSELRIVFGQPVSGREVVQLRLEHNQPLAEQSWALPRIEVVKAKSVRGHVAVAADPGLRLTPERTQGLTEIATAFFPGKVAGIQSAFRLNDPSWQATLRLERLPQTIQVDGLHLFSIGEGVAYGSSVLNYSIAGAPVSSFRVELSEEYFNVEFTGKDVRNWQKAEGGFLVQLHSPVSGPFTLLATYERPFKAQGETLTFTGARPLGTQSDQGHVVIISAYQFQVKPVEVSPGLLLLETREVPAEYRLFFDAPVLAAYRYNSRPFNLKLTLEPLAQGDSLSQVVDRATLKTRISKEGQVLTEARYFVKNRGNPHLRLRLPPNTELWSTAINGNAVVPVLDKAENLIPLPQTGDPNAVLTLDLKLASRSTDPTRVRVAAPILGSPVMLVDWKLEPDAGQRLDYRSGSLTPTGGTPDSSGFAQLARAFRGGRSGEAALSLVAALVLAAAAVVLWRRVSGKEVYRTSPRYLLGSLLGVAALLLAGLLFADLLRLVQDHRAFASRELSFVAPVQQAGSALNVDVSNLSEKPAWFGFVRYLWPVAIALAVWFYAWVSESSVRRIASFVSGWTVLAWAALRVPNGAPGFFAVLIGFLVLHWIVPTLRQLRVVPSRPQASPPASPLSTGASATALLLLAGAFWLALEAPASGATAEKAAARERKNVSRLVIGDPTDFQSSLRSQPPTADSVVQEITVDDKYATAVVKIRWDAEKGKLLPLLSEPAVLTKVTYPTNSLRLIDTTVSGKRTQQILAQAKGVFTIELQYELQVGKKEGETGLTLPVPHGLVNELKLTLVSLDVDVVSPQAVSVKRDSAGSNTVAQLVLLPANEPWVGWKPRSRDLQREKAVFYAELSQLYVPAAGVIEGTHFVSIRPAQGELSELVLTVPAGATITDVVDPAKPVAPGDANAKAPPPIVSLWRFDPDTRKLRVTLNPPQSRAFVVVVRSQVATSPLPIQQTVGLLGVDKAAGEIGLLAVGTGNDVQLDNVGAAGLSAINLEDFPAEVTGALQAQIPGLTVRRAFRYADAASSIAVTASAVEPDVRIESQDTVSLGEDRVVLAANSSVEITRAGIFRLSFLLPPGLDVEAIGGAALSHWTDLKTDQGRVVTLHLNGKTEGKQQFTISLAGAGLRATNGWPVPQLVFREASKQRGTLLLVPEQGLRLQIAASEGLTQLDPQKSGIKQKGVLAFRVLQTPRSLTLNLEQVNPWIQVTSLQNATIAEAQVKVAANLQYQIENTGVKSFRVLVPTNAESVRFQGDQVADFLPVPGSATNGLQAWEIKLHRRVIGSYLLQASWQTTLPEKAAEFRLRGLEALDINLQRGFVTVQAAGRLQVRVDAPPASLQAAEWQSIPRALQQGLPASSANFTYRLIEAGFQLPVVFERHEAAKLQAARVNSITLSSVISDEGVMLTQARLELVPGDERLLKVQLPKEARFWFAFASQNGVWPWRQADRILIPLEKQARGDTVVPVEIFYTCSVGAPGASSLNLELLAPRFELPLENITWRVTLSDKWRVTKWAGALQLQQEQLIPAGAADPQSYLQTEMTQQRQRTKQAEGLLAAANSALQQGDPQQARRDFQAAYGLSTHDAAFNEDARVQLHNIKLQQALIGLNVRQVPSGTDPAGAGAKLRELRSRKELNYTQQDAKEIIDRNSDDENAALMRLAERLIQQQDAAISTPAALRASIPEQGRLLTFKRAVAVDSWADLRLTLKASAAQSASWAVRLLILVATFLLLTILAVASKRQRE
jgi:hypothetical protein